MDTKVITSHQLFTFSALSTLGGSILVISSTIAAIAKQDAWISPLVTMAMGFVMMWIYCFLGSRYQGLTLIGIVQKIFGKVIGKIVAVAYIVFFFDTAHRIPWYIGSFGAHVMHETPVPVIVIIYMVVLVIAIYYGIEIFARASELFYLFVTTVFLISIILVLPNVNIQFVMPVLENGITPILKGAVLLSCYTSIQNITLLMIYPVNVDDQKNGMKAIFKGFLWANTVVFITILVSILVLGTAVVAKSSFPTILLAREINVGLLLTRFEYAISIMWSVSEFVIGILYFYACIKGLSELLGLKEHRKIVAPMGLIVLLYAFIINPSSIDQANYIPTIFLPLFIQSGFVLPVIMLIVYMIKRKILNKA